MSGSTAAHERSLQAELVQLEAWAQEELAAQHALVRALEAQEAAIRAGDTGGLLAGTEAVDLATRRNGVRQKRRVAGLRALARRFGVAADSLTLQSVAERAAAAGENVERLLRARAELRLVASDALRRGRRIASIARHHSALLEEVFRSLAGREASAQLAADGEALIVDRDA